MGVDNSDINIQRKCHVSMVICFGVTTKTTNNTTIGI